MPEFKCQVCDEPFSIPRATLDKYPNWEPKYCREHSPKKKGTIGKSAKKKGAVTKRRPTSSSKEENLTRAEVLEKYTDGPKTGVFTDGSSQPNPGPGGWGFVRVKDGEIQQGGTDPRRRRPTTAWSFKRSWRPTAPCQRTYQ